MRLRNNQMEKHIGQSLWGGRGVWTQKLPYLLMKLPHHPNTSMCSPVTKFLMFRGFIGIFFFFLSRPHAQHGAWTQDPEIKMWGKIKSWMLSQLSHPGILGFYYIGMIYWIIGNVIELSPPSFPRGQAGPKFQPMQLVFQITNLHPEAISDPLQELSY